MLTLGYLDLLRLAKGFSRPVGINTFVSIERDCVLEAIDLRCQAGVEGAQYTLFYKTRYQSKTISYTRGDIMDLILD